MSSKTNIIIQIILLFLIQWLSISVIVLNALALNSAKDSDHGLIMAAEGVQDFVLLIMAAVSLLSVSLLLCTYLQMFYRSSMGLSVKISKKILMTEIVFSISIIALWTSATVIIQSIYNELSACRNSPDLYNKGTSVAANHGLSAHACYLVDTMMIIASTAVCLWLLTLLTCLYSLAKLGGLCCFKGSESLTIHPIKDVWLDVKPNNKKTNDPAIYNEDMQADNVVLTKEPVREDNAIFFSKYEFPPTQSSSDDTVEYPLPSSAVLKTKLKDFNFDFKPLNFDIPVRGAQLFNTRK